MIKPRTWIKKNWMLFFIMLFAIVSRSILIGKIPCGVHADEAFAGYEAYSLIKYGTDSWGYANPVYLTTWGSGMSALESYLMIPFIMLGGLNLITIRLPQMIFGIASVFVVYLLYRRIADNKKALFGTMMIAVCPWHIMMSRWGLDANLAPAFILFAIYFSLLGFTKEKYLIVSAIFWGLSLYCYALLWLFVPFFLWFSLGYCIKYHKIRISKYTISAAIILLIFAIPLLLFVAVNIGLLSEIRTPYFSIPCLVQFRGDELNSTHLLTNLKDLLRIYIKQSDYNLMNAIPFFGLYYLYSLPFIVIGFCDIIRTVYCNGKQKRFGYEIFLLIWLVICLAISLLRSMSIYRANCMNLAMLFLLIRGSYFVGHIFQKTWIWKGILILYFVSFCLFEGYYFTTYQNTIESMQLSGAEDALIYAVALKEERGNDRICITGRIRHSQVLFYSKYPTNLYIETVAWKNYPSRWLVADHFGEFYWDTDRQEEMNDIYVICSDEISDYKDAGYSIAEFDACAVAFR